ncbi:MAG TPA: hypothetical protein EYO61_05785 [Campylobacterales bacterium]|nr:hypothetical protein [Campylobacterales bacterium]HIO71043.1 hypothetical protein [Campylobacterales bacterium]
MEKKLGLDKYPIYTTRIPKGKFSNTKEILDFFRNKIDENPKVQYIATFDHLNHTKSIGGDIPEGILDIQNIIFCFGFQIPNDDVVAVRPRSIGIVEYADSFVINFLEPPGATPNQVMAQWIEELENS